MVIVFNDYFLFVVGDGGVGSGLVVMVGWVIKMFFVERGIGVLGCDLEDKKKVW